MPAAVAAECAREQGKFWEMHDKIFDNQKDMNDENFEGFAKSLGLNVSKWSECFKQEKPKDRISRDQQLAMNLGARGTPAFYINGRFLSGAQPLPAFEALVTEELKK